MRRSISATPARNARVVASNNNTLANAATSSATGHDYSASSSGSRWAAEYQLGIRKNPSFPIQQTAPKPYLAACAEITPKGRNWNAEFQLAWEMENHSSEQAALRMRILYQIERDFEEEAAGTIVKIVRLEKDMPAELLNFVQCFRVRNVFFRVLPDSRSGRNYIASLRGILQSDSHLLSVPLSTMFYYRGMPVLAQALVPMTTRPRRLYGVNSTNDVEVEAELTFIAEALNIPLPDNSMEVYEALDGRYYVTNSNATLTPLFVDDTIMKRQEMLRVCPEVSEGADNTMEVLDDGALQETVLQICTSSTPVTTSAALTQVCEFLHARGVNLCLLKQLVRRLLFASNYDLRAVEQAVQLLSCEMLCRALKQEFYIEIQGKRTAYDELFLTRTLSKYFALVFAPSPQFRAKFLDVVSKKYGITAEDGDLMDILVSFRKEWKQRIMDRVCHLLGATIRKENGVMHVTWRPFANSSVIPRLVEPAVAIQLAAMYSHVRTGPPHSYAFCLPLCCKVACWQHNFSEALSLAHEAATAQEARTGPLQLIRLMMERVVCHVSFKTRDWPCIQDGRSRFPAVLAGYEQWAGPKTQGRRCIEYGFWLVDVAEALMEAPAELRSCVEEAVHYFYKAIARLPDYLRSDHGAWLHLQPYMGLLRCKKLLPSCSVDTRALVQHSVELSKLGWASDFFIDYLRELGRQLEYEGNFADAIQVLLTAISLSKEKPTFTADLHTLLMDVAHIYRSWDLRLHSDACIELTNEAIRYAAQYYGVESREYGVVLKNRGAIEIELGWLDRAEETLRNAGAALNAAGVPHDDPDYVAYVRNLKTLWRRRHPSQPPPTPLSGFLRRFPFLESACKDVPWDDVRPLEDSRFVELARCRAQEADGTNEAYRLEADMKQRAGELFRVLLSGATLKLYPFLPAQLEGVYVEGLLLTYDQIFLELATQWHREPAASPARHLQERLTLAYVSVKARRTADRRAYEHSIEDTFLEVFGASVNALLPVNFSEVVEDAEVQSLMHEYERLKAHNAPAAELGETQARMGQRVHSFELEQWRSRQSISAWVPDGLLHSCFLRDFSRDGALCDLLAARQHAAHTGENVMPHDILEARIAALCMSIWERGQLDRLYCRSESHQLQQRYHLSSPRVHLQPLSDIFEDLLEPWSVSLHTSVNTDDRDRVVAAVHRRGRLNTDAENLEQWYPRLRALQCPTWMLAGLPHRFDPAYQREQLQWQKSDGKNRTAVLAHLSQYLTFIETRAHKARVGVMRCRIRAEAMYPFLDLRYEGVHVLDLALGDDQVFCKDYAEYTRFSSEQKLPAGRLKACEGRMRARAVVLAQQLREREATLQQRFGSYLRSSDPPLQWSSTFIEYTPRVVQCEQYHLTHTMEAIDSKEARHAACCAHKVRSYIRYMSQDQFQRRLVRGSYDEEIAERYPYLTTVPLASVLLSTLPFECRHKFRMLHVTLFAPLRDTERGVRSNAKSDNAAAPVPAPLFCASLRAYQHKSVATKVRRLVGIVEEMAHEENEAQQRLQKAFPGLPHAILGVPTTQLVFPPNFEQQWSLAVKEKFTGLSTQGVYSALVQCAMSARALPLARQYLDELSLTSQPFLLYTTRQCVSLRHLPLRADGKYSALYSDYDALLKLSLPTSPECCLQRVRLAARADQLAMRVTRQWDRLLRQFQQPLTLSDDQLSHLQRHPEILRTAPRAPQGRIPPEAGQKIVEELANHQRQVTEKAIADEELHADLPFIHPSTSVEHMEKDSTFLLLRKNVQQSGRHPSLPGNKDEKAEQELRDYTIDISYEAHFTLLRREQNGLAEHHSKVDVVRVSKLTEEKNQPNIISRYPFLRLHEEEGWPEALVADEAFTRLAAEHADLARDPKRNAAALRGVEDAMNECGDAVAAALRHAALMRDLASRYPFLRLHEEEGWPEALVADEAFTRLAAEHADLARDPKRNAAALRGVEDAMKERAVFILALLSEDLFAGLLGKVYDEEDACRDVVQCSEVSERCYVCFMAVVEGEDVERFLICSEEMDCFSNLFSCWRSSLCEVSEAVRLRVVVELLDVVERESAVCVDVYSEEQSCRSDMLLEFIIGVEALRRSSIVAVEYTAAERLVDTALCNRIMAEDLLCARAQEALLDCHAAEVKSRDYVVADERADRFNLAVAFIVSDEAVLRRYIQSKECASATHMFTRASSERQDILRTRHSQIIKSLEMCVQDETVSRSGLEQEETYMRDVLVEDGKRRTATFSALASQRSFLLQEEVLARKDVELHENEVCELLRGEWDQLRENLTAGQLAAAESYMTVGSLEATEHVPPVEERSTDALVSLEISVALLQRVGRGRLLRKKLQRRLENRRRDILKQGVSHILAEEFMERRTIVGDEHLLWQGLRSQWDRAVPLVRYDDPVDLALQNLMMAEESERDNIVNDYILAHDVIERAEHKQFLKQNALVWVSEAPDSSDEEVDELLFSGLLQGTYSTLTTRSRKNLSRTHYRGFELDALGRFLLDYEEDIHKMQAKLTDFRHSLAMVHDQLKYARDRAAQEVVRGGTGAIWVPARPLPLADLVRGPSAQYEGKRAPRTQ